jgi:type I restriction enzyme S subunit
MIKASLGSVIDIISGGTPKTDIGKYWENGTIGWLSVTDFNNDLRYVYNSEKKITQEGLENSNTKLLKKGDIIISARGTVGALAQIGTPMCFNQSCFGLRGKKDIIDTNFLYYYLKYYVSNIKKRSQGSVFDTINLASFDFMEIEYPEDISCQQKIEAVLSSLDSKIEINNRINAELESMAKALYDYWFVQFDFPNEIGKPYKSSGGKMVWNEELKREIPKGWNAISLEGFEKNIITGKTPSTKNNSYFNGDVPFICIGDIRGNMHIVETEITLTQSGAKTQLNKFIPQGAICVTCIASPGLVGFATKNSQTNQQINSIVCENEENRHYLYFYLKDYFKYARAKTGNTFANMNKGDFSSIKVIIPQKDILDNFHVHIDDSINKILSNTIQNQKLIELRDWLLPLLMNGQLKVN